jgi:hypothetical protein
LVPHTAICEIAVVSLPDVKSDTNTLLPSGETPMLPGLSPNSVTMPTRLPPRLSPRFSASKTQTSARPMPSIWVSFAVSSGWFCPRRAAVMNARRWFGPAKTTSRGSSPTSSVRTTRGGVAATSTTLTLSDR